MKSKKLFVLCVLSFLGSFNIASAAPVGNPSSPNIIKDGCFINPATYFSLRAGYEGNFADDERLKQESFVSGKVNKFSQYANSGSLTLNLLNRLDVFGTYGDGFIKTDWIISEGTNSYSYLELETKTDYVWSLGTKIIFFEWGKTALSLGGRYFYTEPQILWYSKGEKFWPKSENRIKFDGWQVDLGLSQKIDLFIPYISAKYSKNKAELKIDDVIISSDGTDFLVMKNRKHFGVVLGCTPSLAKQIMLNAEVRMIDEDAFSLSAELKF